MSSLDYDPAYRQITDTMQSYADKSVKDGWRGSNTYKILSDKGQDPEIAWEIDAVATPMGPLLDDDHILSNTEAPDWKGETEPPTGYVFNQASQEIFDYHYRRGKYASPDRDRDEMGGETYGFVKPAHSARHANEDLNLSPAEISQFGLDFSGTLNFGLTTLGMEYARLRNAPPEVKAAVLAIHQITNSPDWNRDTNGMSWDGTFRLGREIIRDPISYFGFSSIRPLMTAGRTLAGKAGVQSPFMKAIASTLFGSQVVGAESAALAYYQNILQQRSMGVTDVNYDHAKQAALYGYAAGAAMVPALQGAVAAGRGAWGKIKAIAADASQGRTASMFVGPEAKGVDDVALRDAKRFKKEGEDPEKVRQLTGWFQDKQGKWKTELSDRDMTTSLDPLDFQKLGAVNIEVQNTDPTARQAGRHFVDVSAGTDAPVRMTLDELKAKYGDDDFAALQERRTGYTNSELISAAERIDESLRSGNIGGVLSHPKVVEASPWIAEVPFTIDTTGGTGVRRGLDLRKKGSGTELQLGTLAKTKEEDGVRKTLLHEIQHLIQMREKFARGGGLEDFTLDEEQSENILRVLFDAIGALKWIEFQEMNQGAGITKTQLWKDFKQIYRENMDEDVRPDIIGVNPDRKADYEEGAALAKRVLERADNPFESYEKLAGEAEARLVEQRAHLSDAEIRARNPLEEMQTSDGKPLTEDDLQFVDQDAEGSPITMEKVERPTKPSAVPHVVQTEADNPSSIVNMVYNAAGDPPPPPNGKKWTKAQLAQVLDQQAEDAGRKITVFDDAALDQISDTITNETAAALGRKGNASGWYNEDIKKTIKTINKIHPEIKKGNVNEGMFMLGMAITSNGKTVDYNFKAAEHLYQHFKKTGRFPDDAKSLEAAVGGFGQEVGTLVGSMRKANRLIKKMGVNDFVDFLNTPFTVRELKAAGFTVSSEGQDYMTHGSIIFGPKIGGGFYQNLVGNFNPITFDRWWSYSWGRWTGNSVKKYSEKGLAGQLDTFRARLAEDMQASGSKKKMPKTERGLMTVAREIYKTYKKNNFQPRTELNKAAQRFVEARTTQMELEPGGSGQRNYMRKSALAAIEKLKKLGYNVTPADLQATVWYPEKELHRHYKIGTSRSDPDSYSLAAERFLKEYRKGAKGGRKK